MDRYECICRDAEEKYSESFEERSEENIFLDRLLYVFIGIMIKVIVIWIADLQGYDISISLYLYNLYNIFISLWFLK